MLLEKLRCEANLGLGQLQVGRRQFSSGVARWKTYRLNNALQVPADHGGLRMNITKQMFEELRRSVEGSFWMCRAKEGPARSWTCATEGKSSPE